VTISEITSNILEFVQEVAPGITVIESFPESGEPRRPSVTCFGEIQNIAPFSEQAIIKEPGASPQLVSLNLSNVCSKYIIMCHADIAIYAYELAFKIATWMSGAEAARLSEARLNFHIQHISDTQLEREGEVFVNQTWRAEFAIYVSWFMTV